MEGAVLATVGSLIISGAFLKDKHPNAMARIRQARVLDKHPSNFLSEAVKQVIGSYTAQTYPDIKDKAYGL